MTEPLYGYTSTGRPIDEAMIDEFVAEAERGYDVEALARQAPRKLPEGLFPGMETTGVNPRFRAVLTELAEERGVPTSEVFDEAVRRFIGLTD